MLNNSIKIAEKLIECKAIKINMNDYYTWTSGIKAPIYCDNRQTISYPEVRNIIIESFLNIINEKYPDVEVICGCATAGIPFAALLADRLSLPMVYVRNKPKAYGLKNQIEGKIKAGQKILIVEDLISTGGSALNVAQKIREAGGEIMSIISIFTYNLKLAEKNFESNDFHYASLLTFDQLSEILYDKSMINDVQLKELYEWRDQLQLVK